MGSRFPPWRRCSASLIGEAGEEFGVEVSFVPVILFAMCSMCAVCVELVTAATCWLFLIVMASTALAVVIHHRSLLCIMFNLSFIFAAGIIYPVLGRHTTHCLLLLGFSADLPGHSQPSQTQVRPTKAVPARIHSSRDYVQWY